MIISSTSLTTLAILEIAQKKKQSRNQERSIPRTNGCEAAEGALS
jgi:hypothetical protein